MEIYIDTVMAQLGEAVECLMVCWLGTGNRRDRRHPPLEVARETTHYSRRVTLVLYVSRISDSRAWHAGTVAHY